MKPSTGFATDQASVCYFLFVIEVPHARHHRRMPVRLSPLDCLFLSGEARQGMIGVILNDVIRDLRSLGAPFRPRLNKNVHFILPFASLQVAISQRLLSIETIS